MNAFWGDDSGVYFILCSGGDFDRILFRVIGHAKTVISHEMGCRNHENHGFLKIHEI